MAVLPEGAAALCILPACRQHFVRSAVADQPTAALITGGPTIGVRSKAHVVLRREGQAINGKRTRRLWREEGLRRPAPRKRKRSRPPGGEALVAAERPNQV